MSDVIHVLPDSVANQIAAGEVIQRPSSVVKELVENAIDANASHIQIIIKDAGKTLIQVIDNGKGMSETDARMSFERHATSKIKSSADLFHLQTMGFRGEALASIAAIAQVELRTKRQQDAIGTAIHIKASVVESQEEIVCANGCNFMVKNLFYNVPARRKFLKSNESELRHIIQTFQQIALVYPDISFTLQHNETEIFNLTPGNKRMRIAAIFGNKINQHLLSVEVETQLISFSGFVANPSFAQKRNAYHYFFVNGRYIQHPYFYKAICMAFDKLIPNDCKPSFFIYFSIDPAAIDVNIHPTKTEVKFEHEQAIFPILCAAIKETLGKANIIPPIDFNQENAPEIPKAKSDITIQAPTIKVNPTYNPFDHVYGKKTDNTNLNNWEKLYTDFQSKDNGIESQLSDEQEIKLPEKQLRLQDNAESISNILQLQKQYIVYATSNGLMLVHQQRAHIQYLYHQFLQQMQQKKGVSQQLLFPEILELTPTEHSVLKEIEKDINYIGFRLEAFGKHTFQVLGIPSQIDATHCIETLKDIINNSLDDANAIKKNMQENIAFNLAKKACVRSGMSLSNTEMQEIIQQINSEKSLLYTKDGKKVYANISLEEIEKLLQ